MLNPVFIFCSFGASDLIIGKGDLDNAARTVDEINKVDYLTYLILPKVGMRRAQSKGIDVNF